MRVALTRVALLPLLACALSMSSDLPSPFPVKKLINSVASVVPDFVDGLLLTDSRLRRIEGVQAIVRASHLLTHAHVRVLSGGGSGHEPAHAGYIGDGMLTGAVLGNVFASPSVSAILAAIRVCANERGLLLIVKNYTGDRINFGMAVERARGEGILVRMLVVDDDCALAKDKGITGGRGIAGTVLVHKVAGTAAAMGLSLDEVYAEAMEAVTRVRTMGVALSTCTVPGAARSDRLDGMLMEVGLGIHGEQGRERVAYPEHAPASAVADILVSALVEGVSSGEQVALLINNLGATPALELLVLAREVLTQFKARDVPVVRVYVGAFMTALDMSGVSVSALRVTPRLLTLLDAPTDAPAWLPSQMNAHTSVAEQTIPYTARDVRVSGGKACQHALGVVRAVCVRIAELEPLLTKYDQVCGDGDCGLVMKAGATEVLAALDRARDTTLLPGDGRVADSAALCGLLADAVSDSMGGTSGGLIELMLRAMATHMSKVRHVIYIHEAVFTRVM